MDEVLLNRRELKAKDAAEAPEIRVVHPSLPCSVPEPGRRRLGTLRSLIIIWWKPVLESPLKLVEGGVVATFKPDRSRQLLEQG